MPLLSSWSPIDLPAGAVVLSTSEQSAYVGLADGRVLWSLDGNGPWALAADLGSPATALLGTPDGLLAGRRGGLRRITSDGRIALATGIPETAVVVALARTGSASVAGTRTRGVFRSEDGGATWAEANHGLPFRGAGLGVLGFATIESGLLVAHPLGVSRSDDGGRAWNPSGAGLPPRFRRLAVAASGPHAFAEADGRLFHLEDSIWTEGTAGNVGLLGADADALYGVDAADRFVWQALTGGPWIAHGEGLPATPRVFASGTRWRWAALASGDVWRRGATAPPLPVQAPRLDGVPPFLSGPAQVTVALSAPAHAVLALIDSNGDEALRVLDGPLASGAHPVMLVLDGLPAGLYACRLEASGYAVSRPLAILQ